MDDAQFRKGVEKTLRRSGYLPPEEGGFFNELGKGIKYETYSIFSPDELVINQDLKPSETLSGAGLAGRTIGQYVFYPALILIFVATYVLVIVWIVKHKKNAELRKAISDLQTTALSEAVEELKTGNTDPAAWGEAVIKAKGNEAKARAIYLKLRSKG